MWAATGKYCPPNILGTAKAAPDTITTAAPLQSIFRCRGFFADSFRQRRELFLARLYEPVPVRSKARRILTKLVIPAFLAPHSGQNTASTVLSADSACLFHPYQPFPLTRHLLRPMRCIHPGVENPAIFTICHLSSPLYPVFSKTDSISNLRSSSCSMSVQSPHLLQNINLGLPFGISTFSESGFRKLASKSSRSFHPCFSPACGPAALLSAAISIGFCPCCNQVNVLLPTHSFRIFYILLPAEIHRPRLSCSSVSDIHGIRRIHP